MREPTLPRFSDDSLERQYRADSAEAGLRRTRVALVLAFGLYVGFGALDYLLGEPGVAVFTVIRALVAGWLAVMFTATWRRSWPRWCEACIVVTVFAAAAGIAVMIVVAERPLTQTTFFAGNLLVVMFASGFGLLRTSNALTATCGAGLVTIGCEIAAGLPGSIVATNAFFVVSAVVTAAVSSFLLDTAHRATWLAQRTIEAQLAVIDTERNRADTLLVNILPTSIADRLKNGERPIADGFADVTVLFADLQAFTQLAARLEPMRLVQLLDDVFSGFDRAVARHGVEKVKTIGDAYMAVAGLPDPHPDHAAAIVGFAEEMLAICHRVSDQYGEHLAVRIGINSGPVVAGVIGQQRIIYDLWGDTVNVASRIEGAAEPSRIYVGNRTRELLGARRQFSPRYADLKGRGPTTVFRLEPTRLHAA